MLCASVGNKKVFNIHPLFKGKGVWTASPLKMGPTGRLTLKDGKLLS